MKKTERKGWKRWIFWWNFSKKIGEYL